MAASAKLRLNERLPAAEVPARPPTMPPVPREALAQSKAEVAQEGQAALLQEFASERRAGSTQAEADAAVEAFLADEKTVQLSDWHRQQQQQQQQHEQQELERQRQEREAARLEAEAKASEAQQTKVSALRVLQQKAPQIAARHREQEEQQHLQLVSTLASHCRCDAAAAAEALRKCEGKAVEANRLLRRQFGGAGGPTAAHPKPPRPTSSASSCHPQQLQVGSLPSLMDSSQDALMH